MPKQYTRDDFKSPKVLAWIKAAAKVFYNGDEDATWKALFKSATLDDELRAQEKEQRSQQAHLHLSIKK